MASSLNFSTSNSIAGIRPQIKHTTRTTVSCAATAAPPQSRVFRSNAQSTLYDILGVRSGATFHEIKKAYRRLVLEFHPDLAPVDQKAESQSEFIRIHDAYATLSDPDSKGKYDREMMYAALATAGRNQSQWAQATSASPSSSRNYRPVYNRAPRTWETDQCW